MIRIWMKPQRMGWASTALQPRTLSRNWWHSHTSATKNSITPRWKLWTKSILRPQPRLANLNKKSLHPSQGSALPLREFDLFCRSCFLDTTCLCRGVESTEDRAGPHQVKDLRRLLGVCRID